MSMDSVLVDRSLNLRNAMKYHVPHNSSLGLFGSHPQFHSSSSILRVHPPLLKSPLLPLPPPRFVSASYPRRRPRVQHNKRQQRRPHPSETTPVTAAVPIMVPHGDHQRRVHDKVNCKEEMSMVEFLESVSSKSPPPSSLPLPTFSLMRKPKVDALHVPCVAEAEDGIDADATDDLRRILGL